MNDPVAASSVATRPGVFLDRDGTIIVDKGYLKDPDGVTLLAGAPEALLRLQNAGYALVVITNQSGIGRGYFGHGAVRRQHARLRALLDQYGVHIDAVEYCPHAPDEKCACRKPEPAMILRAAAKLKLDLKRSYMVGDKTGDVIAGRRAGCRTILLGDAGTADADVHSSDLAGAAAWILSETIPMRREVAHESD